MISSRKNRVIKNIVFSFLSKFLIFAIGIFIPRLVIVGYGSEMNGLLTTVSNIYSYLALMEAGISSAAVQALYKPITSNDTDSISSVLVAAKQMYHRITRWYAFGVLLFSLVFPLVIKSQISNATIFAIIIINGISSILTYCYLSTLQTLLNADGKDYVAQIIQFIVFVLNSGIKIILLLLGFNIIFVEFAYLLINILKISAYNIYVKKVYPWINWSAKPNHSALNKRKNFLVNGVAWTVFNSTDTIIISTFCSLLLSSVYAMYNMVFANLNLVLTIFYNSIYFILGQVYHESREKYIKMHDAFESLISAIVFSLLSIAYILILPFLSLYTAGVKDINYIDPYLPILFCLVQILSNVRLISGNLINLTNQPQLTNKTSIIEVIVNLTLSVCLAKFIGIHGVLLATIIALSIKTNYIIIISNKKLLNRSPVKTYCILGVNMLLFICTIIFTKFIDLNITNYIGFIIWGILLVITVIPIYFIFNFIVNPSAAKLLLEKFYHKIKKRV